MVPNGAKWFKMVQNGEKGSKSPKMVKGAKDEVKQARRAQSRPEGPQARSPS